MAELLTPLAMFLRAGAALPFVWGVRDCSLWACEWVAMRTGRDPAASLRGCYRTQRGAYRHILEGGGLEALTRGRFASCGIPEVLAPNPGDVGLIETDTLLGLALAIKVGEAGWAVKSPAGITVAAFPFRVAWMV